MNEFVDLLFAQLGPGLGFNSYAPDFGEHGIG